MMDIIHCKWVTQKPRAVTAISRLHSAAYASFFAVRFALIFSTHDALLQTVQVVRQEDADQGKDEKSAFKE
jgi:hypothetical protein